MCDNISTRPRLSTSTHHQHFPVNNNNTHIKSSLYNSHHNLLQPPFGPPYTPIKPKYIVCVFVFKCHQHNCSIHIMASMLVTDVVQLLCPQADPALLDKLMKEHQEEVNNWAGNDEDDVSEPPTFNPEALAQFKQWKMTDETINRIHQEHCNAALGEEPGTNQKEWSSVGTETRTLEEHTLGGPAESVMSTQQGSTETGDGQNSGATLSEESRIRGG
jgi:hypothetical protein